MLWCESTLEMVLSALSELDPSLALGPYGFTGVFYCMYNGYLALVLLELIQTAAIQLALRQEWIPVMTRCIPKEPVILVSDSLCLITLLNGKIKWFHGH